MLTPSFELQQKENLLIIDIKVPYAKLSEVDVFFEDYEFKFYCKPYFLRLNLPGKVLYQEEPSVQYDIDKGIFTINIPKATPGEIFPDLDLLTKLLAKKKSQEPCYVPKIEVIGEVNDVHNSFEEYDWEIDQDPQELLDSLLHEGKCGFGNQYSCTVFRLKEETSEIFDFDLSTYQNSVMLESEEKYSMENADFSEEHYLADLHEDEEVLALIKFQTGWEKLYQKKNAVEDQEAVSFTPEEKEQLLRLPNKEYLLEKKELKIVFLGLVDVLFAYAYNKRVTEEENTVESAWTINKLSSTFSWLKVFNSVSEVVHCSVRRTLIYPLFRHWALSMKVLDDTRIILSLGRRYVLKCLLEMHQIFSCSDPRHILNDLFITDYCVWLQGKSCSSSNLLKLANALKKVHISKADVGLDIPELECAAELTITEMNNKSNSDVDNLAEDIGAIELNESGRENSSGEKAKIVLLNSSTSENETDSTSESDSSDETSSYSTENSEPDI